MRKLEREGERCKEWDWGSVVNPGRSVSRDEVACQCFNNDAGEYVEGRRDT